ncbi:MAG: cobalamin biosynthesis protein [Chloroflexi bacterium]|nr:cobalamin biosynthesis protein [Chloroflexota bacterium]
MMAPALLALLIDVTLGEPPHRYHPVVWMGRWLALGKRFSSFEGRWRPMLAGSVITLGGITMVSMAGWIIERLTTRLPRVLALFVQASFLKSTLSFRGLVDAATEIQTALARDDLQGARRLLAWHLVSRDTTALDVSQVAAATIESVAENASDGIIAPLFYYAIGGLPLALVYRFVNTADAMLGYRDDVYEWLGKVPARLDDLLNWIPARMTAAFVVLAARLGQEDAEGAWRVWRRDARKTASPNAGHPMSAMAGALGVALVKTGHYRLGEDDCLPHPHDIPRAIRLLKSVTALAMLFLALHAVVRWHWRAILKRGYAG